MPLHKFVEPDARPAPGAAARGDGMAACPLPGRRAGPASFGRSAAWLAAVGAAVADLRTASQAASLYVPVPRGDRARETSIASIRSGSPTPRPRWRCHAAMKLLGGDAPASWSRRRGALAARAARRARRDRRRIRASREAFWKAALIATVDLAASPATSPELLSAMQAGLGAKLGFPPATETWMFHRLEALDATERRGSPRAQPGAAGRRAAGARRHRREAGSDQPAVRRNRRRDAGRPIRSSGSRASSRPRRRWPRQVGGVGRGMLGVEIQAVSYLRLASIAIALARRQRDGGKLPASLAELGDAAQGSRQRRRLQLHARRRAVPPVRRRRRRTRRRRRSRQRRGRDGARAAAPVRVSVNDVCARSVCRVHRWRTARTGRRRIAQPGGNERRAAAVGADVLRRDANEAHQPFHRPAHAGVRHVQALSRSCSRSTPPPCCTPVRRTRSDRRGGRGDPAGLRRQADGRAGPGQLPLQLEVVPVGGTVFHFGLDLSQSPPVPYPFQSTVAGARVSIAELPITRRPEHPLGRGRQVGLHGDQDQGNAAATARSCTSWRATRRRSPRSSRSGDAGITDLAVQFPTAGVLRCRQGADRTADRRAHRRALQPAQRAR